MKKKALPSDSGSDIEYEAEEIESNISGKRFAETQTDPAKSIDIPEIKKVSKFMEVPRDQSGALIGLLLLILSTL